MAVALSDFSYQTLMDRYRIQGETEPLEIYKRCASAFSSNPEHAARMLEYFLNQWVGPATPVLSNAPVRLKWEGFSGDNFQSTTGPMPISCFLSMVADSREAIAAHYTENLWLNSNGGGIGADWSAVRENGSPTSNGQRSGGAIPFIGVVDREVLAVSQGSNRRGAYAAYLDCDHPEIEEFIALRNSGGDANRRSRNIHIGVNITDKFMNAALADEGWDLISPNTKTVIKTVRARDLLQAILTTGLEKKGEPYLHFTDTSNAALNPALKAKGLKIRGSNLCNEIYLPTAPDRTAVCCLSSLNVDLFDAWKDHPTFIADCVEFLDNVLEYFIQNAPATMERAVYSARMERSLGLGSMGWHSYLQRKMIPFESAVAIGQTYKIARHIHTQAIAASRTLASVRGEPDDLKGTGQRNAHVIAIAPTATNSIICNNVSPGGDPFYQNQYNHKTLSGSFKVRNPHLVALVGESDTEFWKQVGADGGSVQNTNLPDNIKEVFKTATEIDQSWVIQHYAVRQEFVCQGQSLNLWYLPTVTKAKLLADTILIWKSKLKGRYYLRSKSIKKADNFTQKQDRRSVEIISTECVACEG